MARKSFMRKCCTWSHLLLSLTLVGSVLLTGCDSTSSELLTPKGKIKSDVVWSEITAPEKMQGLGFVLFEMGIHRYAVLMWYSLGSLAPVRENVFTVPQALLIQFGIILLLLVGSVWIFYRKDSVFEKNVF